MVVLFAIVLACAAPCLSQTFLTVSPSFASVAPSGTQRFTASQSVTWAVNGVVGGNATLGTIDTSGLYTAPTTPISNVIVSAVYTGDNSTMALANVSVVPSGTLSAIAWGNNGSGQLGDGNLTSSTVRVPVANSSGFIQVAGGYAFSVALRSDGTVWAWGDNGDGQLGNVSNTNSSTPVQVSGLSGIVQVAAGGYHAFALKNDGSIWAWGYNAYGNLGNNSNIDSNTPVQVGLVNAVEIAADEFGGVALRNDGTVWAWGYGADGEIGNGSFVNSTSPLQVTGLTDVVSISAGVYHALALNKSGTIFAWGRNSEGELGNGSTSPSASPVQVTGLGAAAMILGKGEYQNFAVLTDGSIWAWGDNANGELGTGSGGSSTTTPVQLTAVSSLIAIACGNGTTVALKSDGSVWAWGLNNYGQLGDGTQTSTGVPVQVAGVSGAVAVGTGEQHGLAVSNATLAFPDHFLVSPSTSTGASGAPFGVAVTAQDASNNTITGYIGTVHFTSSDALAGLPSDYVFSSSDAGVHTFTGVTLTTTGSQTINVSDTAVPAATGAATVTVSAGISVTPLTAQIAAGATQQFTAAISGNASATFTWSVNGIVGGNSTVGTIDSTGLYTAPAAPITANIVATSSAAPSAVGVASVAVTLASPGSTTAIAWGDNQNGELGNGVLVNSNVRQIVSGLTGVVAVSGGYNFSVALLSNGTVYAWGSNSYGELGNGSTTDSSSPVLVSGLSNIVAIAAGADFAMALRNDGTVWAWGANYDGELGAGNYVESNTPVQVSGVSGVVAIAAGYSHALALLSNGIVVGWGRNYEGELGQGALQDFTTPVTVPGVSRVVAIGAGGEAFHSLAVESDGTVWGWGDNYYGELGTGTATGYTNTPVQATGISNAVALAAGYEFSVALLNDGSVWTWGANWAGQLGNGTTTDSSCSCVATPAQVSGLSGMVAIAAGDNHTIALQSNGTVWTWGSNSSGQLGIGTNADSYVPVQAIGISAVNGIGAGEYHSLAFTTNPPVLPSHFVVTASTSTAGSGVPFDLTVSAYDSSNNPITGYLGTVHLTTSDSAGTVPVDYSFGLSDSGTHTFPGGVVLRTAGSQTISVQDTVYPNAMGTTTVSVVSIAVAPYSAQLAPGATQQFTATVTGSSNTAVTWSVNGIAGGNSTVGTVDSTGLYTAPAQPVDVLVTATANAAPNPTASASVTVSTTATTTPIAWGYNQEYELGNDVNTNSTVMVPVLGPAGFIQVAAGYEHSVGLKSDGTVWTWGSNSDGQLGLGNTVTTAASPTEIVGFTGAVAVAAGEYHTLVLKNDGTVWAFGNNSDGELGDGSYTVQFTPVQVSRLTGVIAIAAGDYHSMALLSDGTVWAWGDNYYGEVGNGTSGSTYGAPVQVVGLSGVVSIDGGYEFSIAAKADGTVWTWGNNSDGELGNGTVANSLFPVQATGVSGITAVAAGAYHSLALKNDGTVWTWGDNSSGELGIGSYTSSYTPVQIPTVSGIQAVAGGWSTTVLLKNDGTVWTTGANFYGQLGAGLTPNAVYSVNTPVQAVGVAGVTAISAGTYHVVAVSTSTTLFASQLAMSSPSLVGSGEPFAVTVTALDANGNPLTSYVGTVHFSLSAGDSGAILPADYVFTPADAGTHTFHVTLAAQGAQTINVADTGSGQATAARLTVAALSISPTLVTLSPNGTQQFTAAVTGTTNTALTWSVDGIAGGNATLGTIDTTGLYTAPSAALTVTISATITGTGVTALASATVIPANSAGAVAWGDNEDGELGNGTTINTTVREPVLELSGLTAVAGGAYHSVAVRSDGTVWAWGSNQYGELGNGSTATAVTAPVQVQGLSGVLAVAAGWRFSLALKSDGTVWAWGYNGNGQLGNGTYTNSSTPVQVSGLSGVVAIAAGEFHSLALLSNGTVWTWGSNSDGQLGIGSNLDSITPVQINTLSGVVAIASGWYHSLAVTSDGTVWAWGRNTSGQVGNGSQVSTSTPVQVKNLSGVVAVAGGYQFSVAAKSDGTVWDWGDNIDGQLGNGTNTNSTTPVQVSGFSGALSVSAGFRHSIAMKSDGTVWAWGDNNKGYLGDGTYIYTNTPVQVIGLSSTTAVSAGNYHTLALTTAPPPLPDHFVVTPSTTTPAAGAPFTVTVTAVDANNTVISSYLGAVHFSLGTADAGASLPADTNFTVGDAGSHTFFVLLSALGAQTVTVNDVIQTSTTGSSNVSVMSLNISPSIATVAPNATQQFTATLTGASGTVSWTVNGIVGGNSTVGTISSSGLYTAPASPATVMVGANASGASALARVATVSASASYTLSVWGTNEFGQFGTGQSPVNTTPTQVSGISATAIGAGEEFALALNSDGTVSAWGSNFAGQLGNGTTGLNLSPASVSTLTGVTAIAAGAQHSLAVEQDGSVWAWGNNRQGELGNGTTTTSNTPVQVSSLSSITAVAAGIQFSLALKSDGTVWAWGYNFDGELGNGTTTNSSTPTQVSGLSGVVAIAAGQRSSLALKSDGTVWAWGYGLVGQLGNGASASSSTPVQVSGLSGITAIAAGGGHGLALKSDGTVWAWGTGGFGQLGNGTNTSSNTPVQVTGLTGVTAIGAGWFDSYAVVSGGALYAWGQNSYGQIGDGTLTDHNVPVQVTAVSGVVAVRGGYDFTIAKESNGTVWTWGSNGFAELGNGTYAGSSTPVAVGLSGIASIAGGTNDSIALLTNGTVWSWGYNGYGEVGNGTTQNFVLSPTEVSNLSGIVAVAGADDYASALTGNGTVFAWGYGYNGEMGNGTTGSSSTPVQAAISGVVALASGPTNLHTLALTSAGAVWAWGSNYSGELGAGVSSSYSTTPVVVPISGVIALAAGYSHSLALKNDGTVWAWGANGSGQLGNGTNTDSGVPVQVSGLSGVVAVASGQSFSLALKSDGTVWAWGDNSLGDLGNGTSSASNVPVQVSGLTGVTAISAGWQFALALKSDGTVWAWGENDQGQLGNGTFVNSNTPVQVTGLSNVTAIATGGDHGLALSATVGTYALSVTLSGSGAGAVTSDVGGINCGTACSANFAGGTTVTLTATPATGSVFTGWSGGACSGTGSCVVTVASAVSVTAVFSQTYSLSVALAGSGSGTVTSTPAGIDCGTTCSSSFTAGTTVNLTESPATGSAFSGWSGACSGVGACSVTMNSAQSVTATFNPPVTIAISPASATVAPSGTQQFTATVVNATDTSVVWSVDGIVGGNATVGTITTGGLYTAPLGQVFVTITATSNAIPTESASASMTVNPRTGAGAIAWGDDELGELGNGMSTDTVTPGRVRDLSGVTSQRCLAARNIHTIVCKNDGTVWVWGDDLSRVNGVTFSNVPVQVSGISAAVEVAAGSAFDMVLKSDGTVWTWGENTYGELGNGTTTNSVTPVQVTGLSGVVAIAAGASHALALKSDGTVWAWGNNVDGELGNGTTTNSSTPVQVSGLSGVTSIAAGWDHSIALKSDGTLTAWGNNGSGQLGNGSTTNSSTPVAVSGLTGATAVTAGYEYNLVLLSDGTVWSWGYNYDGELGNGTTNFTANSTPGQVTGLTSVNAIGAGDYHGLAVKSDGSLWMWGSNFGGALPFAITAPQQIGNFSGVVNAVGGDQHTVAVKSDGSVWSVGDEEWGELGDGVPAGTSVRVPIHNLSNITMIAGGWYSSFAVTADGNAWAWGMNQSGQLGNGGYASANVPVQVSGLTGVVAIGGGFEQALALKGDGTVWTWGDNGNGELGVGTTGGTSNTPVQVSSLSGVVAISAGNRTDLALKSDGTVWGWGRNSGGQLGNGTTTSSSTPVQASGIASVVAIAGGAAHTLALKSDGTVWAWGTNSHGQLGNGTTTNSSTPVQVSGLSGVVAIAAGANFSLALKSDGTVWSWGINTSGELGNGTVTDSSTPVQVSGVAGVTGIAAGWDHGLALKSDGTVWSWGANDVSELGDGVYTNSNTAFSSTPVQVVGAANVVAVAGGFQHSLALTNTPLTPLDHLAVSASTTSPASGGPFSVTVTAQDMSNNTLSTYLGTVHVSLTNPDTGAVLPQDYAFTAADQGVHTFANVTLAAPGPQTMLVSDTFQTSASATAAVDVVAQYSLTITMPGTGSGTVSSSPSGIVCGMTCSATFAGGTVVTLTATPATGSVFTGWSGGACSGTGSCVVTVASAQTVTATFSAVSDLAVTAAFTGNSNGVSTANIQVSNSGPSAASAVVVNVTFDRYNLVSFPSNCSQVSGGLTCSLGNLAVNAAQSVSLGVQAPDGGWASITASASASGYDPNPVNNRANLAPPTGTYNTISGNAVTVSVGDSGGSADLDFAQVTAPGNTSLSTLPLALAPPPGFRSGAASVYYDLSSTATYSGAIAVTLHFNPAAFHHPSRVHLFHEENGTWVDRTTAVNVAAGTISGATMSLSPFAIFEPLNAVPVARAADVIAPANTANGVSVTLDGTASTDADGDALTYRWSGPFPENGGVITGAKPSVTLPIGVSHLTLVVNDGEADSAPAAVSITVSDFLVGASTTNSSVSAGGSASYAIAVSPVFGAFNAPVTLACGNLPAGASCSFSPATLTPGSSGAASTLTISTSRTAAANHVPGHRTWSFAALALAPFGFVCVGAVDTRKKRIALLAALLLLMVCMVACGGGNVATSNTPQTTPRASTSTITVTASSGAVVHSTTVSITVQ